MHAFSMFHFRFCKLNINSKVTVAFTKINSLYLPVTLTFSILYITAFRYNSLTFLPFSFSLMKTIFEQTHSKINCCVTFKKHPFQYCTFYSTSIKLITENVNLIWIYVMLKLVLNNFSFGRFEFRVWRPLQLSIYIISV